MTISIQSIKTPSKLTIKTPERRHWRLMTARVMIVLEDPEGSGLTFSDSELKVYVDVDIM